VPLLSVSDPQSTPQSTGPQGAILHFAGCDVDNCLQAPTPATFCPVFVLLLSRLDSALQPLTCVIKHHKTAALMVRVSASACKAMMLVIIFPRYCSLSWRSPTGLDLLRSLMLFKHPIIPSLCVIRPCSLKICTRWTQYPRSAEVRFLAPEVPERRWFVKFCITPESSPNPLLF